MGHTIDKFYPRTTIYFANTGIDEYNKPYFTSNAAMAAWVQSKVAGGTRSITDASFQRDMGGFPIRVDHNDAEYYALLGCDTVMWSNHQANYGPRWMVGHITAVEWRNPNTSFVYYDIDWFTSYVDCIDWYNSVCFIEREHVKKDWDGNTPILNNCGVNEGFNPPADRLLRMEAWDPYAGSYKYVIVCPYDRNGNWKFGDDTGLRRYCGLNFIECSSKGEVQEVLNTIAERVGSNIEEVSAIYTIPSGSSTPSKEFTPPWTTVTGYLNAKCWSEEFNTFRLYVPMGNRPVDLIPEFFGGTGYSTIIVQCIMRHTADTLVVQYIPVPDKNVGVTPDTTVTISQAPLGAWTANVYAQWLGVNALPNILSFTGNTISNVAGGIAGDKAADAAYSRAYSNDSETGKIVAQARGAASIIGAANSVLQDALSGYTKWMTAKQNGYTAKGTGNLGQNQMFEIYGFSCMMLFYQAQTKDMIAIDQYFDRFGYKVNALRAPDPTNRPKWYFLKCIEAHVTDKGGQLTIGAAARNAIEAAFNAGVTIFRTDSGVDIGDFSDPAGNKAQ